MNKASRGDGIPAELFQMLKDDAERWGGRERKGEQKKRKSSFKNVC